MNKEDEHKKQLEEMSNAIEKVKKKEFEDITKQAIKEFEEEEMKGLTPEEKAFKERIKREEAEKLELWIPKTQLGKDVKSGKIKDINEIINNGKKILEAEIVDTLIPNLQSDVLFIGQAKGKFGGGKRRAFRQTQKVGKEGTTLTFSVMAVVGDGNGHVGIGYGSAAETLPAKEKALRQAKLNMIFVPRGCGSYNCTCSELHSIPIETEGKCSSVRIKLLPAPQGTGLVVNDELKKIMKVVGIKDIYSQGFGKKRTTFNTAKACMEALNKLNNMEY